MPVMRACGEKSCLVYKAYTPLRQERSADKPGEVDGNGIHRGWRAMVRKAVPAPVLHDNRGTVGVVVFEISGPGTIAVVNDAVASPEGTHCFLNVVRFCAHAHFISFPRINLTDARRRPRARPRCNTNERGLFRFMIHKRFIKELQSA
jgi:hypothetical protein